MGLLIDASDAVDCVEELDVVTVREALHLDGGLAGGGDGVLAERDRAGDRLGGLVLEDVLELLVGVERDRALGAVVVLHEDLSLRADDEAAGVRHRAVLGDPLGHQRGVGLAGALAGLGLVVAVVPEQRDGGEGLALLRTELGGARGVGHLHDRLGRVGDVVVLVDRDALGVSDVGELEAAERQVHRVAGHVAERAAAEVEEAAPGECVVDVAAEVPRVVDLGALRVLVEERTVLGRREPGVPVEPLADGVAVGAAPLDVVGDAGALRPHGAVRPDVHLGDLAEDPALEDLGAAAHGVEGRALVAHLHDDAVLLGRPVEVVELPEGPDERLLDVDVDALLHRLDGDGRVDVVRRRDRHRVDLELVALLEELAVVGKERNVGEVDPREVLLSLAERLVAHGGVRIAPGDELREAALDHRRPVAVALAHHADGGETDLAARSAPDGEHVSGRANGGDARDSPEESPSACFDTHFVSFCFPFVFVFHLACCGVRCAPALSVNSACRPRRSCPCSATPRRGTRSCGTRARRRGSRGSGPGTLCARASRTPS